MMQNSKDTRDAQDKTYLPAQTWGAGHLISLRLQCHQFLESFKRRFESVHVVGCIVVIAIITGVVMYKGLGRMPCIFKIANKRLRPLLLWSLKRHHILIFGVGSEAE